MQPSTSSHFYVLHDSYGTYGQEKGGVAPFPALKTSDIMLKTMGILRVCYGCLTQCLLN